jgi:hypothetical protein
MRHGTPGGSLTIDSSFFHPPNSPFLRLHQILSHMHDPNPLSIRTLNHILPPTPAVPTLLIQRDPAQRRAHFQALEARDRAWFTRQRGGFAVPHHQRAEAAARVGGRGEDCADGSAVCGGVAGEGHAEERRGAVAAVEGFAEGPFGWTASAVVTGNGK